jgi:hypothetical protein
MFLLFGFLVCRTMAIRECFDPISGIEPIPGDDREFRQTFAGGIVVYYRCMDELAVGEAVHIASPPMPEFGAVLGVRCPEKRRFETYSAWNSTERWIIANVSII